MSDAKANQEPSMEEILASIRRIISEEDSGQPKSEAAGQKPTVQEDLVLTKVVKQGKIVPKPAAPVRPAPETKHEDAEMELAATEPAKVPDQDTEVEQMPSPTPGLDREQDSLVSADVANAAAAAMSRLVADRARTAVEVATPGQGLLVETLVRQAVEPALREWLDNNLQAIVERLVRREIERISRRADLG